MEAKESKICEKFSIERLKDHQREAIKALIDRKDVFVGTKTGSGKSLIYECSPIALNEHGIVVVLAPLTSIMKEQVEKLRSVGYRATTLSTETDKDAVINGYYQFVFGSPEMLIGNGDWRDVLSNPLFKSRHQLIVVDETHTIIHWYIYISCCFIFPRLL